ncbi:MAG: hypothetical protein FWH10_08570 [Oscillospiraceae bacterium]|nr:hypothetical protein [Oscillospiraceae bacterium]
MAQIQVENNVEFGRNRTAINSNFTELYTKSSEAQTQINQANQAISGRAALDDGQAMAQGVSFYQNTYQERVLGIIHFDSRTEIQKADIIIPNRLVGGLEISLSGHNNYGSGVGILTKRISGWFYNVAAASPAQTSYYTRADPSISNQVNISDIYLKDGKPTITVSKRRSDHTTKYSVHIKAQQPGYTTAVKLSDFILSDVYTADAEILPTASAWPFHESWLDLVMQNGAEAIDPLQYRRIGNIVYIRGRFNPNTAGAVTIATLPSGFRPSAAARFTSAASSNIIANGRVIAVNTNGGISVWAGENTEQFVNISFLTN